jgi:outer membrane lipoprotein carrier protein
MKKFAAPTLLASLILFTTILSRADTQNVHAIAQAVDDHYNHIHTLQTDFTETYRGSGMDRTESGTLWLAKGGLKKPGKMRWEYRSPREKVFISDGQSAWFYVPSDNQARKTDARKLEDIRSPLAFLLGKSKLEKELRGLAFAPDVAPVTAGNLVLRGVPAALSDHISDIVLEVNPQYEIVRIVLNQVDGSVTEYSFAGEKENAPIPDDWFKFKPPSGTEVIEGEMGQ